MVFGFTRFYFGIEYVFTNKHMRFATNNKDKCNKSDRANLKMSNTLCFLLVKLDINL